MQDEMSEMKRSKVQRHAQGKYAGEKDFAKQLSDKDPAAAKKATTKRHSKMAQKNTLFRKSANGKPRKTKSSSY